MGAGGLCSGDDWARIAEGRKPINLGDYIPLYIHTFGGKVYVDVSVYGGKDMEIISFEDNVATVLPSNWDKNQDAYAFEVVNDLGYPVFQLYYETQFKVVINGIFPTPIGLVWASKDGMRIGPSYFDVFHLDPIFKYPSSEHQGDRITPLVSDK